MDFQSLFPVYLPRAKEEEETREDYNTSIAGNENNLNQNFSILYNAILELAERLDGGQ